jgi:hypothetical protein
MPPSKTHHFLPSLSSGSFLHAARFAPIALVMYVCASASALVTTEQNGHVAVVLGTHPSEIEAYAGAQLCSYLKELFGLSVHPVSTVPRSADTIFLIGTARTNPAIQFVAGNARSGQLSNQGILLKRGKLGGRPALAVIGGSPRASLWAVYELVERYWGVRYLLHGDVLPARRTFQLPDASLKLEPNLRVRQWRVVNEFACGPASWGMRDYRPVLDQLAKLKYNRILVTIWPHQPFLDYEVGGIQRQSATMFFGYRFPIVEDMIGRSLFSSDAEFWNPDLPLGASYKEMAKAGQRHIRSLIGYARSRGMDAVIGITPTEFPPEFAPLLRGAEKVQQLGASDIVPGAKTKLDDAGLTNLAAAVIRTTVNTYPGLLGVEIEMPEWRQWTGEYRQAWNELDRKYHIERARTLDQVLADAARRTDYPGGAARAVNEVKGDIESLYFYDRLFNDIQVLRNTRRPNAKIVYSMPAEELFPVLDRILPRTWELLGMWEYTPSRILAHEEQFDRVPSRNIPSVLIQTLHDDNVGLLPQLTTHVLARLTVDMQKHDWLGFSTRYWLIGDQDPSVTYLAKASWESDTTASAVMRDQLGAICGTPCIAPMLEAFKELEMVTTSMERHSLGLAFPVPNMIMKYWKPDSVSSELANDCEGYSRALAFVEAAQRAADQPSSRRFFLYWTGRLNFGIGYLQTIFAVQKAAAAEADGNRPDARAAAEKALQLIRGAIESYAAVARDQSDRGAIAMLNQYAYFPLRAKVAELQQQERDSNSN